MSGPALGGVAEMSNRSFGTVPPGTPLNQLSNSTPRPASSWSNGSDEDR